MRKKLLTIVFIVVVGCLVVFGINRMMPKPPEGTKTIYITLIDRTTEQTIIDNQAFETSSLTLGKFFDENQQGLILVLGDHGFGRSIDEFNGLISDMSSPSGPWIVYSSENNQSCVSNGYCLGIDDLPIYDGDYFVFEYTSEFTFE